MEAIARDEDLDDKAMMEKQKIDKLKPEKKKKYLAKEKNKHENTLKTRGYFLKPFDSFYQPRAMEPPMI